MYFNTHAVLFATLSLAPTLISAHGKVAAVVGDAGGNGTAIGIQGGIVPGPGKNKVTEVDTTVFGKTNIATNGLGRTTGQGKNTVSMVAATMAQSGSTLPQVSDGGMVSGTYHIVTTDGAGPLMAMIDPTATGQFANGVQANVVTGEFYLCYLQYLFEHMLTVVSRCSRKEGQHQGQRPGPPRPLLLGSPRSQHR